MRQRRIDLMKNPGQKIVSESPMKYRLISISGAVFKKKPKVQPTTRDGRQVTMFMVTAVVTVLTTVPFRIAFLPHLSSSVMPLIASKFLQVSWLKNGMLSRGRWSYLTKETS